MFNDPFTLPAVTAVCADRRLPKVAVPDALHELVEASLVQVTPRDEPTFHLLDVVRDYATVLLGDGRSNAALRRRYAKYVGDKRDEDFRAFLQRRIYERQMTMREPYGSRWRTQPPAWLR